MRDKRGQFGQVKLVLDNALLRNLEFQELKEVRFFVVYGKTPTRSAVGNAVLSAPKIDCRVL